MGTVQIVKEATSVIEDSSEEINTKKSIIETKKKENEIQVTAGTSRKARNRKIPLKPKLSSQSSFNDELETSSTTTESSNPEEVTETFTRGIQILHNVASGSSSSPSLPEQSKKKKKASKTKSDSSDVQIKENNKNSSNNSRNAKKTLEKQDSKVDTQKSQEKSKVNTSKNIIENQKPNCQNSTAISSLSQGNNNSKQFVKQEAKVKGIPKENIPNPEMRRQQSVPVYDRPPRLQSHGNSISTRHRSVADGNGYSGCHNTPGQPLEGFPTVTVMTNPSLQGP